MEEQDDIDPDFLKGFNEGYTISLYAPELAEKLVTISDESQRNYGFKAGRQQLLAEKEVNKNLLPQWLRPLHEREQPTADRAKDRDKGPDRDKG